MSNLSKFEEKIGYKFKNIALLETALIHSSYMNENKGIECYERLEFLGDSVLGMLTAEMLFETFPNLNEGELTRRRAMLVCEPSFAHAANNMELGKYIKLGRGEENSGGRGRPSILADVLEALVAAIYLDGGMDAARHFAVINVFTAADKVTVTDYKTALQEKLQTKASSIAYQVIDETGPDHDKRFSVEVLADGERVGCGTGTSKKEAEQMAAKAALEKV